MTEDKVDFDGMYYEDVVRVFAGVKDLDEAWEILISYNGNNWVVPYVAGKRIAYFELADDGGYSFWKSMIDRF